MEIEFYNTPTVEGRKIIAYKGFVNASQVAGTGFLTDFVASFSDFFGGHSGVYRNAMNDLCDNILMQLKNEAINRGANAIIGLHLDYDNISAKGTSMFMISAQGTAVQLDSDDIDVDGSSLNAGLVGTDLLEKKIFTNKIIGSINDGTLPDAEDWIKINLYIDETLAPILNEKFLKCQEWFAKNPYDDSGLRKLFIKEYKKYFAKLPQHLQINLVYSNIKQKWFISYFSLFDVDHLIEYANKGEIDFVIDCLEATKAFYSIQDLHKMEQLYDILQNLPNTGRLEEVKGGFLSSGGMKFICDCKKVNNQGVEYCENCGRNIKGLFRKQVKLIENFKIRIDTLKEILNQK